MSRSRAKTKAAPIDKKHPLYGAAKAKWESSGLTDDHAGRLRLVPVTAEEAKAALGPAKDDPAGGVQIPYFDLDGNPTGFFRIRFLGKLPGFAGLVAKPQRYAQPAATLNEVYLPPILPVPWKDVAEDASIAIHITEGEFKAACACSIGLACIGLGGVDVWRSTKRGIDLLPQLKEFKWENREVIVVYDSDAATNPNVVRAQRQLAEALLAKGAMPSIASLPATADGKKQGLDDLLVAGGEESLLEILQGATPFQEAASLWEMNEEVLYVSDPGLVIELSNGRKMDPHKFVSHHYSNRWYNEQRQIQNGATVFKKMPLARRWLDWERRHEVSKIVYDPGKPRLVDGRWNVWPGWGCDPKKGDVSPWLWLLDFVFKKDDAAKKWFEQWAAYPIQHPGTKMYSYVLLWSVVHGIGKGLLEYSLAAIYGKNAVEIDSAALRASFNAWAENRQFVIGNEITAGEAKLDHDKFKRLITRKEITINQKFVPEYEIRDCINYIIDSNSPDAMFMQDKDRRGFVHEIVGDPASKEFYDQYDLWLNGPGSIRTPGQGAGPSHLFHHLLNVDLKGFDPRARALETTSKQNMINIGKSDVGMWATELKENTLAKLALFGERTANECDLYQAQQLLRAYDPDNSKRLTAPGMARELVKAGFRQVNAGGTVRTKAGIIRLYAIRNYKEKWENAKPTEIAKHYEKFFGPDSGKC